MEGESAQRMESSLIRGESLLPPAISPEVSRVTKESIGQG